MNITRIWVLYAVKAAWQSSSFINVGEFGLAKALTDVIGPAADGATGSAAFEEALVQAEDGRREHEYSADQSSVTGAGRR